MVWLRIHLVWALVRLLACLSACIVLSAQAQASTTDDSKDVPTSSASNSLRVGAAVYASDNVTLADVTFILMGIRRGIQQFAHLRYVDLAEATLKTPRAVMHARALLQDSHGLIKRNMCRAATRKLGRVISTFESKLASVFRANLLHAYMLQGVAHCQCKDFALCDAAFQRVLTVRTETSYDTQLYPLEYLKRFDEVRSRVEQLPARDVTVITQPAGLEVFLDGRSMGPSPVLIRNVRTGEHYLTLKSPFAPRSVQKVKIVPGQNSQELQLSIKAHAVLDWGLNTEVRNAVDRDELPKYLKSATEKLGLDHLIVVVAVARQTNLWSIDFRSYESATEKLTGLRLRIVDAGASSVAQISAFIPTLFYPGTSNQVLPSTSVSAGE